MTASNEIAPAFDLVRAWLASHAPRTHATLVPGATNEDLAELARAIGRPVPDDFAALYRACGGQREADTPGIFDGYYFMPLDGVDGVRSELDSGGHFRFAKDFGGSFLALDADGAVIEDLEGDVSVRAESLAAYLRDLAERMQRGEVTLDERIEEVVETVEVIFDAARERTPGDVVKHSVFERLGIAATVETLDEVASRFDKEPCRFGFVVRLVPLHEGIRVTAVELKDDRGRRLGANAGHGMGGGKPGQIVFARSWNRPLPPGSRLHVSLAVTRQSKQPTRRNT